MIRPPSGTCFFLVALVGAAACADGVSSARTLAREAQSAWKAGDAAVAETLYERALSAPDATASGLAETIRRNAGVAALAAGDDARALSFFDGLTGADAATGRGVALFRAAESMDPAGATNVEERVKMAETRAATAEKSAAALREAWSADPSDDAAETRAVSATVRAKALREAAKQAAFDKDYGAMQLPELVKTALAEQRASRLVAATAMTNTTPARIRLLEGAATQQGKASDLLRALSPKYLEALRGATTNMDAIASAETAFRDAVDQADGAARVLETGDAEALHAMNRTEALLLNTFYQTADGPGLLNEAIFAQSNALARAVDPVRMTAPPAAEQVRADGLFALFSNRLPELLSQAAQAGQTLDTNEIARLQGEISTRHETIVRALPKEAVLLPESTLPIAREAHAKMEELLCLLTPPQQNQQQQQQNQENRQDQQKQDQQEQNQQNQQQESDEEKQNDSQDASEEEEQKPEEKEASAAEEKEPEKDEADKMMQAILQREKDRADEKKRRQRAMPARLGERDW